MSIHADAPAFNARAHHLSETECHALLANGSHLGRVGFVRSGEMHILPVNYMVSRGSIVIRTAPDTAMAALDGVPVVFEVDHHRSLAHAGWSIIVRGTARRITEEDELVVLGRGPLRSWAWYAADCWIRISVGSISGRQILET